MGQGKKRYLFYIAQNYSYAILRPLQDVSLKRGDEVCWFLEGNEVDPAFIMASERRLNTIDEVKRWKPDAVFVPGNLVPYFIPGIKICVFHGFNAGKMFRNGTDSHFKIRSCFDLYCTQGPATTFTFTYLANKSGTCKVVETGWSALDPMFQSERDNPYKNEEDKRPTVLLCSTFSRRFSCASTIFEQIKTLSMKEDYRWLIQFHPKMDQQVIDKYKSLENDNLTFVETDDVLPVLQAADVMLCDTSSVMIMFLLQGKPVVAFNNSTQSDYLVHINDVSEIEAALKQALLRPNELMLNIERYCTDMHPKRDGLSSQRVLNAADDLIEKGVTDLKAKPLNFIRHFKMRKKLKYWKL
ncbi:CDP-glycerol glycerophosphotransferase family protein [Shewanella surugensis]|uniref:CDP-glycerol glycerophosphotransferase family protein n=1 Tax=Shewanella surugensis TaxID=212020 RepID=A0ABT0L9M4_9GAMM|nr:CDP-glycerol glycerophosphotransferase family protein [Shewanella surugensis]MCL1124411.1 CDP-glycerol glycerophosphotransferase family protein [Shewanella surugensis]